MKLLSTSNPLRRRGLLGLQSRIIFLMLWKMRERECGLRRWLCWSAMVRRSQQQLQGSCLMISQELEAAITSSSWLYTKRVGVRHLAASGGKSIVNGLKGWVARHSFSTLTTAPTSSLGTPTNLWAQPLHTAQKLLKGESTTWRATCSWGWWQEWRRAATAPMERPQRMKWRYPSTCSRARTACTSSYSLQPQVVRDPALLPLPEKSKQKRAVLGSRWLRREAPSSTLEARPCIKMMQYSDCLSLRSTSTPQRDS